MSQNNYPKSYYHLSTEDSSAYGGNKMTYDNTPRMFANPNTNIVVGLVNTSSSDNGTSENTAAGMVVLPDNTRIFVNDKAAYFAAHPDARASTQRSLEEYEAKIQFYQAKHADEARAKAEKKRKRDEEMEAAGCHGCVGDQKVETCVDCKGNGRGTGDSDDPEGRCQNCKGNGFVLFPCKKCEEDKRKEKASKKGGWSKDSIPRRGPVCDEGN